MQLTQLLHRDVQQDPQRAATVFGDRVRTIAESADRVARFAGALRALGVQPGDRVGIMALNSDRYHEYLLAVPWAGAVVMPVNVRWSVAEVAYALDDCQTDVLLVDDAFAGVLTELPPRKTVIFCGDGATPDGTVNYEDLVAAHEPMADVRRADDDLYGVFYTGGTTGRPRGVMLTHRNMLTSAMGTLATEPVFAAGGRLLHAAPMFHLADIAAWTMGQTVGSTHVIVPAFTPAGVIEAVARHQVTNALLVPTMIQMMVDSPAAAGADLSSLRGLLYGASPMSAAVLGRARAKLPDATFTQAYGMTELSPVTTLLRWAEHNDPVRARSVGRSVAHAEIRILDPMGAEVARGVVGEICVRGDHVMQGYWNKPEETATALRDGWMHTGDGGYMDDGGYVFIADRIKDMIITGGENVYSIEVENALAGHPAVAQCAVIGVPDTDWGERVHAVVVLVPGASATLDELRDFCRPQIAGYKVPRSIAFAEALPISAAGKVLKRELRQQYP
jgi:acyl-CoA synthetase (AMP-forming)/AMP-acid ligase II